MLIPPQRTTPSLRTLVCNDIFDYNAICKNLEYILPSKNPMKDCNPETEIGYEASSELDISKSEVRTIQF